MKKLQLNLLMLFFSWNKSKDDKNLVAWFSRIDSHDSRESADSRESEIRVIQANRPDAL